MNWVVYILRLSNGAFYTGVTNNLTARLKKHAQGKGSRCVRSHLPFEIVWSESVSSKSEALRREAAIKKLNHKQKSEMIGE